MDVLPTEILHEIFLELSLIQKQECMYVCHRWKSLIREHSLLHTIFIPSDAVYKRLVKLFDQTPSLKNQVNHVTFGYDVRCTVETTKLLETFPNARLFESTQTDYVEDDYIDVVCKREDKPDTITSSATQPSYSPHLSNGGIEKLTYYRDSKLMRSLLASGQYQQLVSLKVLLDPDQGFPYANPDVLKYLPNLKQLFLVCHYITIQDCEAIHKGFPLLESLKIQTRCLSQDEEPPNSFLFVIPQNRQVSTNEMPKTILPTRSLTNFSLFLRALDSDFNETIWLNYISKKYPCLTHFEFTTHSVFSENRIENLYMNGYLPLLKALGPQLKSLNLIQLNDFDIHFLKELDAAGCQVNKLRVHCTREAMGYYDDDEEEDDEEEDDDDFDDGNYEGGYDDGSYILETLEESKQVDHIESLFLEAACPKSFKWLSKMKNLKQFKIHETRWTDDVNRSQYINLNRLFDSLPETVTDVDLHGFRFSATNSSTSRKYKTKKIFIGTALPSKGVGEFLSKNFPYLESLTIYHFLEPYSTLSLPGCHLLHFEISHFSNVALTTLDDNKTRYYAVKDEEEYDYYPEPSEDEVTDITILSQDNSPVPRDAIESDEFVNIICGSVKTFVYNGTPTSFIPSKLINTVGVHKELRFFTIPTVVFINSTQLN